MKFILAFLILNNLVMADIFKIKSNGQFEPFKWKSIQDSAKKICWQKGMIRLFADETNDWTKKNRINLNIEGLGCLNYQDTLAIRRPLQVQGKNFNKDYGNLCISPGIMGTLVPWAAKPIPVLPPLVPQTNVNEGNYGCTQVPLVQTDSNLITLPWDLSLSSTSISSVPDEKPAGIVIQTQGLSSRAPYIPAPFLNAVPISQDDSAPGYFINKFAPAQSVYLPLYIGGRRNIISVSTSYYLDNKAVAVNVPAMEATEDICQAVSQNPKLDLPENTWCIQNSDYTGGYDVLHIHGFKNPPDPTTSTWGYGGFTITFNTVNTKTYDYCNDGGTLKNLSATGGIAPPCNVAHDNDPMKPSDPQKIQTIGMGGGNSLYYLTMLGRLELLGIPEIFYEPLYCNSNREQLVPDMFSLKDETRTEFEKSENSKPFREISELSNPHYLYGGVDDSSSIDFANPQGLVTFSNKINHPEIFSKDSFRCCIYLGKETSDTSQCCSNFSTLDANGKRICKLPPSTDLNVYFNRFVSDDGVGENQPGGGLKEEDFIPETGEPKLYKEVTDKIRVLGQTYCVSGNVRYGGAFGYFYAQPNNGYFTQTANPDDNTFYSIIDSSLDYQGDPEDTLSGVGTLRFLEGYRWNHHLYCAP